MNNYQLGLFIFGLFNGGAIGFLLWKCRKLGQERRKVIALQIETAFELNQATVREERTRKMNVLLHGFVRDNARIARHMVQLGHKVWDLENATELFDSQQERIEIVAGKRGIPLDF